MGNKITVTCQTWAFKSSTLTHSWDMCQTWVFLSHAHLPNLTISETYLPNLSIPETNSLAKLEHSRNKFTCQTWAFQRQIHLPNLSILEMYQLNLSIPETNSLAKLEHFRDILAKLEHSIDKFTCQTWVLPVPRHTHLPNMNIQETYSFAKFLHSSDKLAAKHECSWDNIYCIYTYTHLPNLRVPEIYSQAKLECSRDIGLPVCAVKEEVGSEVLKHQHIGLQSHV